MCAFCIPVPVPGLARYAVLPSPPLASGPQLLLLSKSKAQLNHAESTLLKVLILKQLKVPLESITFEKPGEGSPLWLINCCKTVSTGMRESQPSIFRTHFQVPYPATLLFAALTKTPGGVGVLFPFRNSNDDSSVTKSRTLLNFPNRRTAPSSGTSRTAHPAVPGPADSSAPPTAGPALHPGTAPPLQSPCAPRLPALPRFRPQFPILSNP